MQDAEPRYQERIEAARRLSDGLAAEIESASRLSRQSHRPNVREALASFVRLTSDLGASVVHDPPVVDDYVLGAALAVVCDDLLDFLTANRNDQALARVEGILLSCVR